MTNGLYVWLTASLHRRITGDTVWARGPGLADLADATGSAEYCAWLAQQADAVWSSDRDALNRLGRRWAGTAPDQRDRRIQASALEALTAAAG
ncbi:hypothetical protein [Streptomyces naphthomycinicus]|uniref:hypothetical protein n=1 Tax=Streptomyces naphthomycinicus TaxID=2872625 RepID=UPI001CEE00ED|nr:hypothetical protein [Streptomyces sp. TML10]